MRDHEEEREIKDEKNRQIMNMDTRDKRTDSQREIVGQTEKQREGEEFRL